MKRKNFYLSDIEIDQLESESTKLDMSVSDLLRRIVDDHFKNQGLNKNITFNINEGANVMFSGLSVLTASGTKIN